jgi:hypothetical protein
MSEGLAESIHEKTNFYEHAAPCRGQSPPRRRRRWRARRRRRRASRGLMPRWGTAADEFGCPMRSYSATGPRRCRNAAPELPACATPASSGPGARP